MEQTADRTIITVVGKDAVGIIAKVLDRKAAFAGCLPDQAELIDRALILTRTQCVALIVCEDPDAAQEAFESCFEGK